MQGPPVNLVLLGLLVLFFGLQLYRRNEQPFTGWLVGWVLVFLSYIVWDVMPLRPALGRPLEMLRVDSLLLGIVSFLLSFLHHRAGWRPLLKLTAWTLVPALLLLDLQLFHLPQTWIALTLVCFGGIGAFFAVYKLVPRRWSRRRGLLYALCLTILICIMAALRSDPDRYLAEAILAPLLVGTAVLYLASSRSQPSVRALGGIGFLLWAEFYLFASYLPPASSVIHLLYQFWDIPKYFVGTAMILDLFEASRQDVARLAERYRLLYENLDMLYEGHPHPMWICAARSRHILSANTAAVQSYGYSLPELLDMQTTALELPQDEVDADLAHPDTVANLVNAPALAPDSRRALHRRKNGEIISVVVTERPLIFEGRDAIVVLAVDVTQQDKLHQDLFHRAHHDPLTQLPNRGLLADRIAQVLARSERDSRCAVLLTIDVDHFKQINDTYGHPVGDECLKLVAARLQSRIRQVDTLARTGGEEFTAIIGNLSRSEDAEIVAESLRRLFDAPLVLAEHILPVTVSIGGALYPGDGTDIATLIKRSDDALYRAKRSGRNRCVFTTTPQPVPSR